MKVIIFGGAGYLGGALAPILLDGGHQVTVFDNLSFGSTAVSPLLSRDGFTFRAGDLRDISAVSLALRQQDAVVLLASLVGEPACDLNQDETVDINYLATINAMKAAIYVGVKRFIFSSTDSCYGAQENVNLTEESPVKPISLYADLKTRVEEEFMALPHGADFQPVILRLATLYGLSPRMRFDLVINLLTREAVVGSGAKIFSGDQWRPLVHVRDAARAFALALRAPAGQVSGQIFNVGSNEQNVQFKHLRDILLRTIPGANIETVPQPPDLRDYHVCFNKISQVLNFTPNFSPEDGVGEIREALLKGLFGDPYDRQYRNA